MADSSPMTPTRRLLRRTAVAVTVLSTLALAAASAVSIWTRAHRDIPYPGIPAMSAPWSPMPEDEHVDWLVSTAVPPPAEGASRRELLAWLERYYPILEVSLSERQRQSSNPHVDIGGWPRHLTVEPGVGLVMRAEPR